MICKACRTDYNERGLGACPSCGRPNAWSLPENGLSFSKALEALMRGKRIARTGWNGKGMWLALQEPDAHSKMKRPYIYMSPVDGALVPWVASQSDLLASDWMVVT